MSTSGIALATPEPNGDSERTVYELINLQNNTQVAQQELKIQMRHLVDSRLGKEISLDQFKVKQLAIVERQAALHSRHQELRTEIHGLGQYRKKWL